jgi:serine/threonine-protein kinase
LIAGRPLTPASDQYAIGIMFYELLTGKPPFDGQTVVEIARQHALSAPPPIYHENPRVPRYLEQILDRTLAKDPARRYPSVKQLGKLLAAYRQRGEAITQPLPVLPKTAPEPPLQPVASRDTSSTGTLSRPTTVPAAGVATIDTPPRKRGRVDWLMLILAALALVAVLGLVPLWTTVFGQVMELEPPSPTAALSTPTATIAAAQPTEETASAATATAVPFVQVPNLLGLELEAAQQRASEMGLELRVNKDRYDSEVPAQHIYSQTPPPDAQALAGSEIVVVISLGPEPIAMPSVTGFPAGAKRLELEELGLDVTITEIKSQEPAGLILEQEPQAGAEIQAGSMVTLTVSDGTYAQVRANLDDKVLLLSCELNSTTFHPGDTVQVTLVWQVLNPIPDAYTTFIHVTDAGGKIVTQLDRPPLQGNQPTNTWTVGAELIDPYNLILPKSIEPGMYEIHVGLYIGEDRLPVLDPGRARASEDAVVVHQITITDD